MRKKTTRKIHAKKPSKATLKKAVQGSRGVISRIADQLDCDWHTALKYVNSDPDLIHLLESEKEIRLDRAETTIDDLLDSENEGIKLQTSKYILSTAGKKRGWTESLQLEHSVNKGNYEQMSEDELVQELEKTQKQLQNVKLLRGKK